METELPAYVSVLEPLTPAIDRVKMMLFRPFNLEKWFIIGFCAFLANLGSGGGGNGGGGPRGGTGGGSQNFGQAMNHAKEYVLVNLAWIVPLAIFGFVLVIAIMLVLAWLSSRGRFMFLHCVAHDKAEVKVPWAKFREHANSLFLFRIVLGIIGFLVILVPIILMIILIAASIQNHHPAIGAIFGFVFFGFSIFLIAICLGLVSKFTTDFVIPIMFLRTVSIRAAWHEFMSILSANKGRFFVYILFQIVISIVIGIILLAIMVFTCCCACCFFAIPYIGTVVLLPVFIFNRSYSLYYLRQYGPQFDIFGNENENPQPQLSANPF
jgi:hypothetical protein